MPQSSRRDLLGGSLILLALAGCASEPPPPAEIVEAEELDIVAVVETVDRTAREVLLRGPEGGLLTVRVSGEVRNFDRIRSGDRVAVHYRRALAAWIAPAGAGGPDAVAVAAVERVARGRRPAGVVGDLVRVRVVVQAVDRARNTVTFVGPRNVPRTVTVRDPEMRQLLRRVNPGDQVDILYEEALAVTVTPAPR